jgi:hypothetical protein
MFVAVQILIITSRPAPIGTDGHRSVAREHSSFESGVSIHGPEERKRRISPYRPDPAQLIQLIGSPRAFLRVKNILPTLYGICVSRPLILLRQVVFTPDNRKSLICNSLTLNFER